LNRVPSGKFNRVHLRSKWDLYNQVKKEVKKKWQN